MKALQKYTKHLVVITVILLLLLFFAMVPNVMSVINDLKGALGLVAGALLTILGVFAADFLRNKESQRHNAALLFSQLQSVENYLRVPFSEVKTNIRYWDNWPELVAGCDFLSSGEVGIIYNLYDLIYEYNQLYASKDQKEKAGKAVENAFLSLTKEVLASPYINLKAHLATVRSETQD